MILILYSACDIVVLFLTCIEAFNVKTFNCSFVKQVGMGLGHNRALLLIRDTFNFGVLCMIVCEEVGYRDVSKHALRYPTWEAAQAQNILRAINPQADMKRASHFTVSGASTRL